MVSMKMHLLDVGALVLVLGSFATELLPIIQVFAVSIGGFWYSIQVVDYFHRTFKRRQDV